MAPKDETEAVAQRLRDLGLKCGLRGMHFHDANVVATMATHGIRDLATENEGDFTAFDEIEPLTIADLVAGA